MSRVEQLAEGVTVHLGDMLEILPTIGTVSHVVTDPPYEDETHKAFNEGTFTRTDGAASFRRLGYDGINSVREDAAKVIVAASDGWALVFCIAEGVRAWRDALQASGAKWDTTLGWVKPDATPRLNGQGASRGSPSEAGRARPMSARFDYDHEAFLRRLAEDPANGYPPDFANWPPEARRKWIAANTEAILADSDHLVGGDGFHLVGRDAFIGDDSLGYFPELEEPPRSNGDGRVRNGHEAHGRMPILRAINPAVDWKDKPVKDRKWIVPGYIPDETPTMLSGDGGTGKSWITLQLAAARDLARDWLGLMPEPGSTLVLSAEDDEDEMHRRLDGILKFYARQSPAHIGRWMRKREGGLGNGISGKAADGAPRLRR